jgi:putative RNA 2'-phosphotransferase
MRKWTEVSKFLSYVLRHKPEAIGIVLDCDGWTDIDALIAAAVKAGKQFDGCQLDRALLEKVVITSEKKRFAISSDDRRIRAVQGHSAGVVDIAYVEKAPPEYLYHGTAAIFLDSIRSEGLKPGTREYVHLSPDPITASDVGERHGKPVVLKIRAREIYRRGQSFYHAENGVWLTGPIPAALIFD